MEAGNLRPDDALRSLFEKAPHAAAVACFPDEARDLEGMIREVLAAAKLQITPDARTLLVARLGADRGLSRAEVEKLALYALGKGSIEESDVEAAVGDAAELALDRIVMAAASGRTATAVSECDRSIAGGEDAQTVILAVQRYFLRLHRTRSALDAGRTMDEALRQLKPAAAFQAEGRLRAAVPRLEPGQAQRGAGGDRRDRQARAPDVCPRQRAGRASADGLGRAGEGACRPIGATRHCRQVDQPPVRRAK